MLLTCYLTALLDTLTILQYLTSFAITLLYPLVFCIKFLHYLMCQICTYNFVFTIHIITVLLYTLMQQIIYVTKHYFNSQYLLPVTLINSLVRNFHTLSVKIWCITFHTLLLMQQLFICITKLCYFNLQYLLRVTLIDSLVHYFSHSQCEKLVCYFLYFTN